MTLVMKHKAAMRALGAENLSLQDRGVFNLPLSFARVSGQLNLLVSPFRGSEHFMSSGLTKFFRGLATLDTLEAYMVVYREQLIKYSTANPLGQGQTISSAGAHCHEKLVQWRSAELFVH